MTHYWAGFRADVTTKRLYKPEDYLEVLSRKTTFLSGGRMLRRLERN
jgi:hypothetical protein